MSLLNCPIFLKLNTGCILPLNWIPGTFENVIILGYPPMIRCLSLQSSISGANGDWRSQIEKQVVISVRSNLAQKSSTDRSEPKFGGANPAILAKTFETSESLSCFTYLYHSAVWRNREIKTGIYFKVHLRCKGCLNPFLNLMQVLKQNCRTWIPNWLLLILPNPLDGLCSQK